MEMIKIKIKFCKNCLIGNTDSKEKGTILCAPFSYNSLISFFVTIPH